jgi:PAT family beta-lactamase induction signal transducer AmpG
MPQSNSSVPAVAGEGGAKRPSFAETFVVYFQRRVLVVLLLGFSSGLPIILVGSTLQAWMTQNGIDIRTIGLISAVAVPYNIKFLWAPLVDTLEVPVLSPLLGRRRGWLLLTQVWLILAILLLGLCDPAASIAVIVVCAVFVATASATQDIVIDAFRIESLSESEQGAGMASYVAAYRVGALVSGAGALLLVTFLQDFKLADRAAWSLCYAVMAALILIGVAATFLAREPERLASAAPAGDAALAPENLLKRTFWSAVDSFRDFLTRDLAFAVLAFVVLFKLADAFAFALLTPFTLGLGFSLPQIAGIRNFLGFIAAVLGGFAGGFVARALPLSLSLWVGGILQTIMIFAFCIQALVGKDAYWLSMTTFIEFFADSVGTVIFVAYLSALCRNPLYTATQFALLTAFAALGRNVFSVGTGYVEHAVGWPLFFVLCAAAGLPALALLARLQKRGHFHGLSARRQ